jgi:zinc transport system substrate-binding protein
MQILYFLLILISFFSTSAIASDEISPDFKVISSIKPIASLVDNVLGQNSNVIVDGKNSLHGFTLKPSVAENISKSKIIFYIDDCFETFMKNALNNASKDTVIIKLSDIDDLKILDLRNNKNFKPHAHKHSDLHEHEEHTGANIHENHQENSKVCNKDFHIWLSPENSIKIVNKIALELAKIYPAQAEKFKQNAKQTNDKILQTSKKIIAGLQISNKKNFLVFHDAYYYFEDYFKVFASGSVVIDPALPQTPKKVSEVIKNLENNNIKCIFKEPNSSVSMINNLIKSKKIKVIELDAEGVSINSGKDLYFEILNQTSKSLLQCFAD